MVIHFREFQSERITNGKREVEIVANKFAMAGNPSVISRLCRIPHFQPQVEAKNKIGKIEP